MRVITCLLALAALAACGVDGAPQAPEVHGKITVGTQGVSGHADVSVTNGPVTVGIGI